ncbi:hypothetical protein M0802_014873 [Mischocyttarus mexicanus]|nr:hypothetical protein M0802_014873 [Mischocyttarus mexicanus]
MIVFYEDKLRNTEGGGVKGVGGGEDVRLDENNRERESDKFERNRTLASVAYKAHCLGSQSGMRLPEEQEEEEKEEEEGKEVGKMGWERRRRKEKGILWVWVVVCTRVGLW